MANPIPEKDIIEYCEWLKANNYQIDSEKFDKLIKDEPYHNLQVLKDTAQKCLVTDNKIS